MTLFRVRVNLNAKGNPKSALNLFHHKNSTGRGEDESYHMDEDFFGVEATLPVLTRFFDTLNKLIDTSKLSDALYRIRLCSTAYDAQQKNLLNDHTFYIDKKSLVDSVDHFLNRIKQGKQAVDVPVFFHLINFIRDQAIDKWL